MFGLVLRSGIYAGFVLLHLLSLSLRVAIMILRCALASGLCENITMAWIEHRCGNSANRVFLSAELGLEADRYLAVIVKRDRTLGRHR